MERSDEILLERLERIPNPSMDQLEGIYDHRPIWELYVDGNGELREHVLAVGPNPAVYRTAPKTEGAGIAEDRARFGAGHLVDERRQLSVFVRIGDILHGFGPYASVERLQLLDPNNMVPTHAGQKAPFKPIRSSKTIFVAFDRELSAFLNSPGVKRSEFVYEVVERGPEVVSDLSDPNTERDWRIDRNNTQPWLTRCRIILYNRTISLGLPEVLNPIDQIDQVFPSPFMSGKCAVKGMRHSRKFRL